RQHGSRNCTDDLERLPRRRELRTETPDCARDQHHQHQARHDGEVDLLIETSHGAAARTLERDEFRSAPPSNQSPFFPAEAGTQGPRTRPKNWVPASAGTNGIESRFMLISSRPNPVPWRTHSRRPAP